MLTVRYFTFSQGWKLKWENVNPLRKMILVLPHWRQFGAKSEDFYHYHLFNKQKKVLVSEELVSRERERDRKRERDIDRQRERASLDRSVDVQTAGRAMHELNEQPTYMCNYINYTLSYGKWIKWVLGPLQGGKTAKAQRWPPTPMQRRDWDWKKGWIYTSILHLGLGD